MIKNVQLCRNTSSIIPPGIFFTAFFGWKVFLSKFNHQDRTRSNSRGVFSYDAFTENLTSNNNLQNWPNIEQNRAYNFDLKNWSYRLCYNFNCKIRLAILT